MNINTSKIDFALQQFLELPKYMQQELINEFEKMAEKEFFKDLPRTKSPSPDFIVWKNCVPELRNKRGLQYWSDACKEYGLDPTGKSGRRLLKRWAKKHKPEWPEIPEPMKLKNKYAAY